MNETFLKTFLRMGIGIALRIPLRIVGAWLLAKGYVEANEWELFGTGAALIAVDLAWYGLERRGVMRALAHKDAIINQQEALILDQGVALDRRSELVEIALKLPTGATVQDALAIQENQGFDSRGTTT